MGMGAGLKEKSELMPPSENRKDPPADSRDQKFEPRKVRRMGRGTVPEPNGPMVCGGGLRIGADAKDPDGQTPHPRLSGPLAYGPSRNRVPSVSSP